MSSDNTYRGNPEQESIKRYFAGEMTAAEMHAFEKAALNDPFLADAIEGMSSRNPDQLSSDAAELKQRLEKTAGLQQIRLPRIVMWRSIAVAAAVVALAILSTWFFVNRQPQYDMLVQSVKSNKPDSTTPVAESKAGSDSLKSLLLQKTAEPDTQSLAIVEKNADKSFKPIASPRKKDTQTHSFSVTQQNEIAKNETELPLASLKSQPVPVAVAPPSNAGRSLDGYLRVDDALKNKSVSNNLYFFTGQVTDVNQQPISFANISVKNSNHLTYTDAKGNFRLLSADSSLNIDIRSVGFAVNSTVLSYRQPQYQLVLNPLPVKQKKKFSVKAKAGGENELNEADSSSVIEDSTFISTEPEAEPADGWGPYHLYLLNNVRQQKNPESRISEGTVVVSFLVNPNGWLTEFKIEKSLCSSCDREAIRLIREGPKWELYNTDKPLRTKVTVSF